MGIQDVIDVAGEVLGIGDIAASFSGNDNFAKLFKQDGEIKQYSEQVTDRSLWHGVLDERTKYAFLLRYRGEIVRIPFLLAPQREVIIEPHAMGIVTTQGGGKIINSDGCTSKEIQIQGTCGLYPGQRRSPLPISGVGSGLEGFKLLQNVFRRYCYLKRFGDFAADLHLVYVSAGRQEAWVVEPRQFWSEAAVEHKFHFTYNITLEALYPYDGKDTKSALERAVDSMAFFQDLGLCVQRLAEAVDKVNASIGRISAFIDGFIDKTFKPLLQFSNIVADVYTGKLSNLQNITRDSTKSLARGLRQAAGDMERIGGPGNSLSVTLYRAEKAVMAFATQDPLFVNPPLVIVMDILTKAFADASQYLDANGNVVDAAAATQAGASTNRAGIASILGSDRDGQKTSSKNAGDNTSSASAAAGIDEETRQRQAEQDKIDGLDKHSFTGQTARPSPAPGTASRAALYRPDDIGGHKSPGSSALSDRPNFATSSPVNTEIVADALMPPETRAAISQSFWNDEIRASLRRIDPKTADYRVAIIHDGDSIQTIAHRLLGDPGRWQELVFLNNLEFPYVAKAEFIEKNGLSNVLPYGGNILYPVPKEVATIEQKRVWRNETDVSLSLPPRERALGNDVYIDADKRDVSWAGNDLQLVYGAENIGQKIRTALTTKRGGWRCNLSRGLSSLRGISRDLAKPIISAEISSSLSDDDRISAVQVLSIEQQGAYLFIKVAVFVRNFDDPIIVTQRV